MQLVVFARSTVWPHVEELLLDEWDALFTQVYQAKPIAWDTDLETHRIGHVLVTKGSVDDLRSKINEFGGHVFAVPRNDSVVPHVHTFLEKNSLRIRS